MALSPEVWSRAQRALALRRLYFRDELRCSAPSFKHYETTELSASGQPSFAAISITGARCELACDHCQGRLIASMTAAETPEALREVARALVEKGCRGLLISGGCDSEGRVPLEPFLPVMAELKEEAGLELAVHTGLADRSLARGLAEAGVDQVMVDLVGDEETALEVLHLRAGPERFERSLEALIAEGLPVTPHVVVGLHQGELRGERRALAMAARHPVAAVVLVFVRPEPGTPFAELEALDAEEAAALMAEARLQLPRTRLLLGCARPLGRAARELERWAVRTGFNGVAFPAAATVRLARQLGLQPILQERCCSL